MLIRALILMMALLGPAMAASVKVNEGGAAPPVGASLNEEVVRIPAQEPPAVTMEVTLMHPDGNGPFPLAVMNHSANGTSADNRGNRYHRTNAAFYFLSRGYAVALPMMRGFSTTGGAIYHIGCDFAATASANAKDIAAVIRYLGNDPRFDTRKVIVAGQSMGGWNTLAVGAMNLPNVAGLVNFNGGLRESGCLGGDASLIDGAATFGGKTHVPSIWFYGDNDELFSKTTWRSMYDRYTKAGGHAEIVDVGEVMKNSHNFLVYPEVLPLWTEAVDGFLAKLGMPHTEIHPNDLPTLFPPASGVADINDIAAVPYLTDKGRSLYQKFLTEAFPRAFVVTPNGGIVNMRGGFDPLGRALATCRSSGSVCQVYAVDDRVVWHKPEAMRDRNLTMTIAPGESKTVDFSVQLNPDCSAKTFSRFRIVQQPSHGKLTIEQRTGTPNFAVDSPFALCNAKQPLGMAVEYTAQAGYTGADAFAFSRADRGEQAPVIRYNVTVRGGP